MKSRGLRIVVFVQLFLLVSLSFAVAFFMQQSFVSASPPLPVTTLPSWSPSLEPSYFVAGNGQTYLASGGNVYAYGANGQIDFSKAIGKTSDFFPSTGVGVDKFATTGYKPMGFDLGLPSGIISHLAEGLVWAGIVYGAAQLIGPMLGLDKGNTNALSYAGLAGVGTYKLLEMAQGGTFGTSAQGWANWGLLKQPLIPALVVTVVVFILLYKKTSEKIVSFQCLPYEPPIGGAKCEECNKDSFRPCSEYRCKSLGQACQLLNKDKPGQEMCAWVNPKDVTSPTITPWKEALSPYGLTYISDTSVRPPALGVKIVKNNGCLPAFTPLKFGITTNEPAQCKIDYTHTGNFSDMQFYFGESNYYEYNHSQIMKLPSPDANTSLAGSPLLKNDGTLSLYVRCQDANGNANVDEYAVSFCVDKSPDTTPPIIENTSILSGSPVRYQIDQVPIQVYVNEPADCRWSQTDKAYSDMENNMSCVSSPLNFNANYLYPCSGNLTGIKDRAINSYYFRCRDQPGKADKDRNTMSQSYKLDLLGSQPLNIISVGPNETIKGPTTTIPVNLVAETSNGADSGRALCYFSTNRNNLDSFIKMYQTDSYLHNQTLNLVSGTYTYYIRCLDAGGNSDMNQTTFNVQVDKNAPMVTRVYHDGDALKIVTDEDAICSYSLNTCNFNIDDGIKMLYNPPTNLQQSFAAWKPTSVYYIKCKDLYDNEPAPNQCSLIASAVEISKSSQ